MAKKNLLKTKIYFCFPHRGVGGVPLLFLRLAHAIAEKYQHKCILVDYPDGYMATRANSNLVDILHYDDDKQTLISGNAIVLFQSMTPWSIFPGLSISDDVRVLFWNCHPLNLAVLLPGLRNFSAAASGIMFNFSQLVLRSYRARLREFVRHLMVNNGLVFMDHENVVSTEMNIGLKVENPVYIPIPALNYHARQQPVRVANENSIIHLCWVGRIVDFKYFILKRMLDDISRLTDISSRLFKITIVGDGSHLHQLKIHSSRIANYEITFVRHLEESELNEFLVKDVDILFAMGTSALEGAKLGVPTILLDLAYTDVPETYVYRWLFQRDGSTLGETLRDFSSDGCSYRSLDLLIAEFLQEEQVISQKTYSYFVKNHSMEVAVGKLLSALDNSTCLWGRLRLSGLVNRGLIYPLFNRVKRFIKI